VWAFVALATVSAILLLDFTVLPLRRFEESVSPGASRDSQRTQISQTEVP
jgi:hypothetical protein